MGGIDFSIDMAAADMLLRLGLAAFCGLLIGFEREARDRPAGMRTHMLTSLAAALFAVIAIEMIARFGSDSAATQLDPVRVVEAVTAGVAFLAAGTIIQSRGSVKGLTTGAGMWLAGAVGLASGAGFYLVAASGTVLALLILLPFKFMEDRLFDEGSADDRQQDRPKA
ncbi:MgtC/SapB family protein [Henriciella mobilis]|uniref:MgtC/SapB family protein n=1 Tax=Henriciella mobilis TaxID=2305467 RepID=UPI000E6637EE|nr:MgtC/SapB family protein [Henriciella mobilis]RIJ16021.1 MgtC/SapB family protein [Henriciella mobilis]RIJ23067.1 MgtC/SapB family protein [Henriciella mobilis]